MSLAAVQKHVAVLERARLVTKRRRGREQLVRTDVATVQEAHRQLETLEEADLVVSRRARAGEAAFPQPGARPADPRQVDHQVHRAAGL